MARLKFYTASHGRVPVDPAHVRKVVLGQVGFLVYPQAETGGARKHSLDPDGFEYRTTSREIGI